MKHKNSSNSETYMSAAAFTLIELLVVVAILSLLMAILVPTLNKARTITRRALCQSKLRGICLAWKSYLNDNNDYFYQGVNHNHDFGGWRGSGGYALFRPLNRHCGLPNEITNENGAVAFRCPADSGGIPNRPSRQLAYDYFGNSYQTNTLLIGPNYMPGEGEFPDAINRKIKKLSVSDTGDHGRLLLVGDNNWVDCWEDNEGGKEWHGRLHHYNFAFMDGHVGFVEIEKGLYLTDDYRIQPFPELDKQAREDEAQN